MLKNKRSILAMLLVLPLLLLSVIIPTEANAKDITRKITLTSVGKVKVEPDSFTISYTITNVSTTEKTATLKNQEVAKKATDKLKALGVESKNIKTVNFQTYPEYGFMNRENTISEIIGYRTTHSVEVNVLTSKFASKVVSELVGVDDILTINGTTSKVSDPSKYEDKAVERAIALNKKRAELYAKRLGVKLLKPIDVREGTFSQVRPPIYMAKDAGVESSPEINVEINPGQEEVQIQVTITWQLG